ncbi:OB-fold protein [Achromobacter xylosoxidans]|uniref:OB-fold protein n=1 Tax=Alcaligenes xylosoxydans xylosoxydans TaxID=85698 RepID=UPI0038FC16BA
MKQAILFAIFALYAAAAHPASFDCSKARSVPERLICDTPELSAADENLKAIFDVARSKATNRQEFNSKARQAWNWREQKCRDVPCLRQWYQDQKLAYSSGGGHGGASENSATPQNGYRAGPPLGATRLRPEPKETTPPADNQISAEELYRAYDANEVAADMKFKGRPVTIVGNVEEIGVAFNGNPYLALEVKGEFLASVRLNFSKAMSPRLAELSKGMKVQAQCVVLGMTVRTPILNCPG